MSINEVIKFIYSNTTDDYIIVDCQILEELVENLKNNTKPIYPLDEIKGVVADIKASLPIDDEMEDTLEEFVAEIDSKFFNGDKIEERKFSPYVVYDRNDITEEEFKNWYELNKYNLTKDDLYNFSFSAIYALWDYFHECYNFNVKDIGNGGQNIDFLVPFVELSKTKKPIKIKVRYYIWCCNRKEKMVGWIDKNGEITNNKNKIKYFDLEIDANEFSNELFHIYHDKYDYDFIVEREEVKIKEKKNLKESKTYKKSLHEKKSAKIPNIGYRKMGDIIANMNWDKLDSANFKNMGYRLDDFYVDERFAINQKDYMKAFNKCEDNPKMLGKEVSIKATRLADNQPLTIICELDERADVEKLYMYDFNIVEVMLDTF